MKGYGTDVELARRIEAVAKVPATTTTTAVVQALEALDIRRMFLLTPYPEDFNKLELRFFTDHGVEIPRYATFDCKRSWDIPGVRPEAIVARVLDNRQSVRECGALFISCTNLHAMQVVDELERELDVPVVTSNSATLWSALHHLGMDTKPVPAGRLFGVAPAGERRQAAS